jgi:prepilin-type N-terminal cleavage/methylation domain-containing protein
MKAMDNSIDKRINTKRGFTLIELVVSMAIFLIIVVLAFGVISRFYLVRTFYEQQMNLQQNFLYAMDKLSDDFRQASIVGSTVIINPDSNAMIDATLTDPLEFYGSDGVPISYYLKGNGNGTYAIYRKVGSNAPQPITEEMHQLVKLYFISSGGKIIAIIVGEVTYFGKMNKVSFTSMIYSRNSPQQEGGG